MRYRELFEGAIGPKEGPAFDLAHEVLTHHGFQKAGSGWIHPNPDFDREALHNDLQGAGWKRSEEYKNDRSMGATYLNQRKNKLSFYAHVISNGLPERTIAFPGNINAHYHSKFQDPRDYQFGEH